MKLDFYSQPMSPDGGSIAQLASQAIRDSNLLPKHVMLREALQNSCDQRISSNKAIDFVVALEKFEKDSLRYLRELISSGITTSDPLNLKELLQKESIDVLMFADRGTKGLGGATDASKPNPGNFVRYFYIFGRLDEIGSTDGGAFGAGRTTLNNASQISSVLVYSRFKDQNGVLNSRFMGLANGLAFEFEDKMYTGRHWWCKVDQGQKHPIEGKAADEIAAKLGMSKHLKDTTGFVAAVIAPIYTFSKGEILETDRKELMADLIDASYLYGWPHMVEINGKKSVNFEFYLDGKKLDFQKPEELGHLVNFVETYRKIVTAREKGEVLKDSEYLKTINFNSSNNRIGILGWNYSPAKEIDIKYADEELIPINSVALIRNARFVVKYQEISKFADNIATRAVFLVDHDYETQFRASEPIAHDDWIPSRLGLKKGERNPVKQSIEEIRSTFKSVNELKESITDGQPMLFASNLLGAVLGGTPVAGISDPKKSKTRESKHNELVFNLSDEPYIIETDQDFYTAKFTFQIEKNSLTNQDYEICIKPKIAIVGGGIENEAPVNSYTPTIKEICFDDNVVFSASVQEEIKEKYLKYSNNFPYEFVEVSIQCKHGLAVTCFISKVQIDAK